MGLEFIYVQGFPFKGLGSRFQDSLYQELSAEVHNSSACLGAKSDEGAEGTKDAEEDAGGMGADKGGREG